MKILLLSLVICFYFNSSITNAQDDCCGTGNIFSSILGSGIFGGYGFQQFGAEGFNEVIQATPGLAENFDDFGFAWGWRAGANLIQIQQDDLLIGLKFYYQSVKESQTVDGTYLGEDATQELTVELENWSFGMGLSYIINNNFDIRILDAYMTFPNATITNEIKTISNSVKDEYEPVESNIGFTFDTGLVFYPLPPYIALEVIGGYSFFSFGTLETSEGYQLTSTSDIVDSGGFFAVAVLTIGIPFN